MNSARLFAVVAAGFSESLNPGNKDIAVQEVANISIVAVVPLCVPTLRQRRAPWAR
jgi:hypothetical protein